MTDTIFALSSGHLPAGVAVMRLSGPAALTAAASMVERLPRPRHASLKTLRDRNGLMLDKALVLIFDAPHSFTGEDCVEFHLHGSKAVVSAVSNALSVLPGLRQAEPGEFSRRAFENGKLDLVEVEGLADLISAETEMQRRLAIEQSFGGQNALYMDWAKRLTRMRALIEADLDFADEDDVPGSVTDQVWPQVIAMKAEIDRHIEDARAGEMIRDGYKIVIAGPPNAGKSSLLNSLARRDVAIVTDIAGTTRDILHVDLDMQGYLVRLYDTAGLRESADIVEREGIRRALSAIEKADLILLLAEIGTDGLDSLPKLSPDTPMLRIGTKHDLHGDRTDYDLCLSTQNGDGIEALRLMILARLKDSWSGSAVPGRLRQIELLHQASNFLAEALNPRLTGADLDIRAETLRAAAATLGRITGRVDVEQLLDVIFSQFCIGK